MQSEQVAPAPRVLVRRESIWLYPAPLAQLRPEASSIPPGRLLATGWVLYATAADIQTFEDTVVPVMTSMRAMRSHLSVGFLEAASRFNPNFLRYGIDRSHALGVPTVVELGGSWTTSALELLWSTRPRYLRVGPEHVAGVSMLPEQHQSVSRLSEFAKANGIPLVARGVRTREERAALRSAGVELYHVAESGPVDADPLDGFRAEPPEPPPTVLRFPLRPTGR